MSYQVTFQCGDFDFDTELPSIGHVKDGFWVDAQKQFTHTGSAQYFIMPHMVKLVQKEAPANQFDGRNGNGYQPRPTEKQPVNPPRSFVDGGFIPPIGDKVGFADGGIIPTTEFSQAEIAARQLIDVAHRAEVPPARLIALVEDRPALTERQCQSIAVNYPYSWERIDKWFNQ